MKNNKKIIILIVKLAIIAVGILASVMIYNNSTSDKDSIEVINDQESTDKDETIGGNKEKGLTPTEEIKQIEETDTNGKAAKENASANKDIQAEEKDAITYKNTHYGFQFSLPASWEGYTIVTEEWEGFSLTDPEAKSEKGETVNIRHPKWTEEDLRQDIPIMVFTLAQWKALEKDEIHVGAAPANPSELGRNAKYVFALPARYNFSSLTGFEEVEEILNQDALVPNDNFK